MRSDKRGAIDENLPPILERLHFEADNWFYLSQHFESKLKGLVGSVFELKQACNKLGYQRTICKQSCEQFFPQINIRFKYLFFSTFVECLSRVSFYFIRLFLQIVIAAINNSSNISFCF